MNYVELAFGISALAFGVGLLVMHLPIPWLRRHGWTSVMHSLTGIIIIVGLGSLSLVKALIAPYVEPYIGVPLTATYADAMAKLEIFREMVHNHIMAVNNSTVALGAAMAVMLLATSLVMITGVGILTSMIANYIVSAVFGLFLFVQKALSAVYLFIDIVEVLVIFAQIAAPALFIIGVIMYVTPFARTLGKTLMVLGAGFALALPPVIVAALPSTQSMQEQIDKSKMVQAYSIALDGIREMQGGVRVNFYDRNGTVVRKDKLGVIVFEPHESRPFMYPYFRLTMKNVSKTPPVECDILPPNISCDEVKKAARMMLKIPESGFVNSEDYYDSRNNGYRLTLTLPEDGNESRKGEFYPDLWVIGMWLYLQGEHGEKNSSIEVNGLMMPDEVYDEGESTEIVDEVYEEFKEENEEFWDEAPYEKIYAYNAVQQGHNTTFIWFTETPLNSTMPLNLFKTDIPEMILCRKWRIGNRTVCEHIRCVGPANVAYFAYLNGTPWSWEALYNPSLKKRFPLLADPDRFNLTVEDSRLSEFIKWGLIKDGGPLSLDPAVQTVEDAPKLYAYPPTRFKKIAVPSYNESWGFFNSCSLDAAPVEVSEAELEEAELIGEEVIHVTHALVYFIIDFKVGEEISPYVPQVNWKPFDEDEQFLAEAASGAYVPDELAEDTHREEWDDYPIFRLSLYRDGPIQYGSRLVVQRLDEFKDETWENSTFGAMIYNTVREAYLQSAGQHVAIPVANFLLGESGGVGILDAVVMVVGCTASLALALIIFVVCLDVVSGFVGGKSTGKALFTRLASALSIGFTSQFLATMRGLGFKQPSIVARAQSLSQMNRMYRQAVQSRRMNLERWRRLLQMRRGEAFLRTARDTRSPTRFTFALGRERMMAARDAVFERMMNLRGRLDQRPLTRYTLRPLVDAAVMRYATGVHKFGVLRDAEYARRFKDTALLLKQSRPVKTSLREFGEGAAKMMRETSLTRRMALADHLARHPKFGRTVAIKGLLGGLGAKVRAPAAFKVAAESTKPRTDIFGGIRPDIPYAFISTPYIGFRTKDAPEANIPYIHRTENPVEGYHEVNEAVKSYEDLVRPLGEESKYLGETLAGEHLEPPVVYEKPEWLDKVVEIEAYLDNRHEPVIFETRPENVDSLLDTLDHTDVAITSASVVKSHLSWEDTQEAGLSQMRFHDYGPQLSDDLKESFYWVAGDAIDRAPHKGYTIGDVVSIFERESSQDNLSPEVKGKNEYRGWWNE